MKRKIYIVASDTAVTVVCSAYSKKEALNIATTLWEEEGYFFDQNFVAYPALEYFEDFDEPKGMIFP